MQLQGEIVPLPFTSSRNSCLDCGVDIVRHCQPDSLVVFGVHRGVFKDGHLAWVEVGRKNICPRDWYAVNNEQNNDSHEWNQFAANQAMGVWGKQLFWFATFQGANLLSWCPPPLILNKRACFQSHNIEGKFDLRRLRGYSMTHMNNKCIYVAGGYKYDVLSDQWDISDDHFAFSHAEGSAHQWLKLPKMLKATAGHQACVSGHNIYYCGGTDRGGLSRRIQIYCTKGRDDHEMEVDARLPEGFWTNGFEMEKPKSNLGLAVIQGYLYAIDQCSCERMSIFTGKWELINSEFVCAKLSKYPGSPFGASCCAINGKLLVVFSSRSVGTAYQCTFDPAVGGWSSLTSIPICGNRSDGSVVLNSKIFNCNFDDRTLPGLIESAII